MIVDAKAFGNKGDVRRKVGTLTFYAETPTEAEQLAEIYCLPDPLAAANALPGVVAALAAILDSSETALPVDLAEKAEDALNALKGETNVHATKL